MNYSVPLPQRGPHLHLPQNLRANFMMMTVSDMAPKKATGVSAREERKRRDMEEQASAGDASFLHVTM